MSKFSNNKSVPFQPETRERKECTCPVRPTITTAATTTTATISTARKAFDLAEKKWGSALEKVSLDGSLALTDKLNDSIEVQFMVKCVDNSIVFCLGGAPSYHFLLFYLTLNIK